MNTMMMTVRITGLLAAITVAGSSCGDEAPAWSCDPPCPAGSRCAAGGCVSDNPGGEDLAVAADMAAGCSPACGGATPHCNARGQCVPCVDDQHCPTGQICKTAGNSSICAPGCNDDSRCAGMGVSFKCCGGGCIDTSKDSGHCGGCGVVCGGQHATAKCTDGACMLGACSPGWGDCNMNAADGCEVNTASDPGNCTGCGMACNLANAVPDCAGKCRIRACRFGWDDCDGKEDNGCELKVLDNNANCGGCGLACPFVAHAKNACVNAACQLLSCDAGYSDCDGMMQNGCEVATGTDVNNCGMCGVKCAQGLVCRQGVCTCPQCNLPNARSTCVNFQCAVDQCNINWGDCDGLPQNGCELNLTSDAKNCGQCSKACAQGLVCQNGSCTCPNCMLPNAKTACINNMCVLDSCFQGFGNCDGNNANGCEVDLSINNLHCGACGKACGGGNPFCMGGICESLPPTCRIVNGVRWCYHSNCGIPCTQTCKDLNLPFTIDNPTWFAAQTMQPQCTAIANAFGINVTSIASYTYGCVENEAQGDTNGGPLTGRIICSTSVNCPSQLRNTMDQVGTACNNGGRHAVCPCQ